MGTPRDWNDLPLTKFRIPELAVAHVDRPRLRTALSQRPVTVIVGLPGSGKTSAAAEWAAECAAAQDGRAAYWLSCDEPDADPRMLWTALARVVSGHAPQVEDALSETLARSDWQPEHLVGHVVNAFANGGRPAGLVIEDLHLVGDAAGTLVPLIERLPPELSVIITTRTEPPLHLARLRARGQVQEIRDDQLGLTADETAAVLQALRHPVTDRVAEAVATCADGWVAAVRLAAEYLGTTTNPVDVPHLLATNARITDLLEEEVFAPLPSKVREMFGCLSVLEDFTAGDCAALTGTPDADALLRDLRAAHPVLIRRPHAHAYRLHRLVAGMLHHELLATDPVRVRHLHETVAARAASQGNVERAVRHYVAAGNQRAAIDIVDHKLSRGEQLAAVDQVEQWLHYLDEREAWSDPTGRSQAIVAGSLVMLGRLDGARRWLLDLQALRHQLDPATAARVAITWVAVGTLEGDVELARHSLERAQALREHWTLGATLVELLARIKIALWDNDTEAVRTAYDAVARTPDIDRMQALLANTMYAEAAAAGGYLHEARELATQAVDTAAAIGADRQPTWTCAWQAIGLVHYERGELEDAERALQHALDDAADFWTASALTSHVSLCRVWLAQGRADEAADGVVAARSHLPAHVTSPLLDLTNSLAVRVALAHHDLTGALAAADAMQSPWRRALLHARIHCVADDLETAWAAVESADIPKVNRAQLDATIVRARIKWRERGPSSPEVHALVADALDIAEPEEWVRPFFEDGDRLWSVLRTQLRARPPTAFAAAMHAEAIRCGQVRAQHRIRRVDGSNLAPREIDVLQLLDEPLSNRDIAQRLFISPNTLKTHIRKLYRKLGVSSREEATQVGRERGLL